ncbi:MAG: ferredoxin [Dehalococcoidales bacterium]|nr:ferredoxin [Dehalococcoidales bacterium]
MKVRVERDVCIGVGNCVVIAPTVFQFDRDNKAEVLNSTSVDEATLWEAAESCPVKAIILEDEAGQQVYP